MEPNRERIALWVTALESGNYEQTTGALRKQGLDGVDRYCCLGVACVVAQANGGPQVVAYERGYLPNDVAEWFGFANEWIRDRNPIVAFNEHGPVSAVEANDNLHWDFKQIADGLRSRYLGEEVAIG